MPRYVYIAKARTGRYYTGITTNPRGRLVEHNKGKGSRMARQQGPFTIVYTSTLFFAKAQTRKREIQIKGWNRKKKEKLVKGEWKQNK